MSVNLCMDGGLALHPGCNHALSQVFQVLPKLFAYCGVSLSLSISKDNFCPVTTYKLDVMPVSFRS